MITEDVWMDILDRDETWFWLGNGCAEIIYDCALLDC
jgi:hypothetical protein